MPKRSRWHAPLGQRRTLVHRRRHRIGRLLAAADGAELLEHLARGLQRAADAVEQQLSHLETLVVVRGILLQEMLREIRQRTRLGVQLLLILAHPVGGPLDILSRVATLLDALQKPAFLKLLSCPDNLIQAALVVFNNCRIFHDGLRLVKFKRNFLQI